MRIVFIDEALFPADEVEGKAVFHELVRRELGFPAYYGRNLAALDDCLGDISSDTRIIVRRMSAEGDAACGFPAWFTRACRVLERASDENPFLTVQIVQ